MAINLISIKCPGCGADLSVEDNREFSSCSYCGTKVKINNDNEYIYRTIDEAGIKQAETDRIVKLTGEWHAGIMVFPTAAVGEVAPIF